MMTLIFFILFAAILAIFFDKKALGYGLFGVALIISLYWLNYHATDPLSILL
ncbi:DUF5993 family protein [Oleiphilus sp. HI0125]|uniref:DUF5993 family protein n=1 Tax=Oleiphilus sp. HI0125 TaxID=1822266 RepID=UPI003512EB1A